MAVLWLKGHVPQIPEITDEEIETRLKYVQPVDRFGKDKWLHTIQPVNPRNIAFTWDPKPAQKLEEAYEVARIETYHSCGYIACFKPTIAEVLAQIPPHLFLEASYFMTLKHDDVVGCYSQGDGHRTVTILYSDLTFEKRFKRAQELQAQLSTEEMQCTKTLLGIR